MLKGIIIIVFSMINLLFINSCGFDRLLFNLINGGEVNILLPEKLKDLKVGEEFEIPFKISNEKSNIQVKISTNNVDIIEITSQRAGLIKALKIGKAVIQITYGDVKKYISISVTKEDSV